MFVLGVVLYIQRSPFSLCRDPFFGFLRLALRTVLAAQDRPTPTAKQKCKCEEGAEEGRQVGGRWEGVDIIYARINREHERERRKRGRNGRGESVRERRTFSSIQRACLYINVMWTEEDLKLEK